MKKATAVVLVIGLLMTFCVTPTLSAVDPETFSSAPDDLPTEVIGDADRDGELTILDATRIQRFLAAPFDINVLNYAVCDFDNDKDITIMDATAIQRELADIPVSGNLDYRPAKHPHLYVASAKSCASPLDETADATLYTSRDQLDPALVGHQTLLNDYDEAFFAHDAILAVHTCLPSGSDIPQFDRLVIENNKLTIKMLKYEPEIGTANIRNVFFCIEVKKSFFEGTDGVQMFYQSVAPRFSIDNNNVDLNNAYPIPADYAAQGFTKVAFEEGYRNFTLLANENYPGYCYKLVEARGDSYEEPRGIAGIFNNPYDMELMIRDPHIKNGADPKYWGSFSYEIDRRYEYDLKFFKNHALVAITQYCNNSPSAINVRGLYKKDGVLYIVADKTEGNQCAVCDALTLVVVKRSDLDDVSAVNVGRITDGDAVDVATASVGRARE